MGTGTLLQGIADPLAPAPEEGCPSPVSRRSEVERWLARSGSPLAARVRTVRELQAAAAPAEPAAWSAELPGLAALYPAGLPRGELVELSGRASAGRFGLLVGLLAAATAAGENAALVDLGDGLDAGAAHATGVDLARLLWVRPHDLRQSLAAAESLLAGGFALVAVDLGLAPVPGGRGSEAHWLRLARAASAARALLVVSTPYRACGVAAGVALTLARARSLWQGTGAAPRLLGGLESRVEPARPAARARSAAVDLRLRLAAS